MNRKSVFSEDSSQNGNGISGIGIGWKMITLFLCFTYMNPRSWMLKGYYVLSVNTRLSKINGRW